MQQTTSRLRIWRSQLAEVMDEHGGTAELLTSARRARPAARRRDVVRFRGVRLDVVAVAGRGVECLAEAEASPEGRADA